MSTVCQGHMIPSWHPPTPPRCHAPFGDRRYADFTDDDDPSAVSYYGSFEAPLYENHAPSLGGHAPSPTSRTHSLSNRFQESQCAAGVFPSSDVEVGSLPSDSNLGSSQRCHVINQSEVIIYI